MAPSEEKQECHEALTRVHEYVDRELPADLSAHVKEHITTCPPCEGAFKFEADFKSFIAKRCQDEMPSALYSRVTEILKIESVQKTSGN